MTASTFAKIIFKAKQTAMMESPPPCWIAGKGTPNGSIEPFKSAKKGSLYTQLDAADDAGNLYVKVAEDGDNNDWVLLALSTELPVG